MTNPKICINIDKNKQKRKYNIFTNAIIIINTPKQKTQKK